MPALAQPPTRSSLHFSTSVPSPCPSLPPPAPPPAVQLETRGITSHVLHTHQVRNQEFWESRFDHKSAIAAKLREAGSFDLADSLDTCHTRYTVGHCLSCGHHWKFANRCDNKICPVCQPRIQRQRVKEVQWWTARIQQPKHVTLTLKNTQDFSKSHILEAKRMLTRLRRSTFARSWKGGFYSWEITNEGRGWHLHVHLLIDCKWIDAPGLAVAWNKATGGAGYIVKVRDARGQSYLHEVTKYVAKGAQVAAWSAIDVAAFAEAFEGLRTFGTFGVLWKQRPEWRRYLEACRRPAECPECSSERIIFSAEEDRQPASADPAEQPGIIPPSEDDPELELDDFHYPRYAGVR